MAPAGAVQLEFEGGTLVLRGRPADVPPEPGDARWTWDPRVAAWRCPALHYAAARAALAGSGGRGFRDRVALVPRVFWPQVQLPVLRAEQAAALAAWERAGRRGVVVMPTGTGKTEVALAAMAATGVATLVVAPVRDLMYQWHRRILTGLGYDAGVLGDNHYNLQPVTVTTYDSAYIHMPTIGARFGLIVFDEVHHLPGECRREAAWMATAPWRLGLTATLERADGRHADLDELVGPVVHRVEMAAVRGTTLAEYQVQRVTVALTEAEQAHYDQCGMVVRAYITRRRQEQPGYSWEDLCAESGADPAARYAQKAYWLKKSIEDRAAEKLRVLEDLFRLHAGERVLVFTGSNAMALEVSRRFLVPTLLSHSRKRERHEVLGGFARGEFPVLVANQVLDEGVDVPEAKVAVVLGGLSSTRQAKQRLGRILRRTGNRQAVLYEVVCEDTKEVERSRKRRRSDAYQRTSHRAG